MMGMPTCREVARAVASGELDRAAFWRRLAMRLHLSMCRHCGRYARQLDTIGRTARELLLHLPSEQATIARLREAILRRGRATDADD